jgi:hypothetical protein
MDEPRTELTLALIKPDAVQAGHVERIMHTMEKHGFVIVTHAFIHVTLNGNMKRMLLLLTGVNMVPANVLGQPPSV